MTNPVEAMARAICRAHRTGSGNMSERDTQETEDRAWHNHVVDARAALQALKDNVTPSMAQFGAYAGDFDDIICPDEEIERRMAVIIFREMIDEAMKEETDD